MTAPAADVKSLFGKALEMATAAERAAFLDEACAGNAALRDEVEGLLQALERAGNFMGQPAPVASVAQPPLAERPGTVIGPYKLLEAIGEGGMGTVFLAEQTEPVRRKVALKIIKPGMDSAQVIARFEAERQTVALMDHPNIARVLDAGTTNSGRPYFVMELVKGVPLTEFCDQNKLTTRQRLELFIPVCQAIQHAHMKGIIHRDIKPSNVLVTLYDGKPVPKVIDFGIAKATDQRLTERTLFTSHGQIVGTFEYMSPEQATFNALDVDTRSDVYSLGVLLYELLTGSTPIDKERLRALALDQLLRTIREEEPPRPSARLSSDPAARALAAAYRGIDSPKLPGLLRGELDWIVMKALDKARARRYETASAFAGDVERYLNDGLVEARPPSAGYRLRKFVKRNRGTVLAASLVLSAVLAGIVGTTWGWVEALSQRDDAFRARNEEEKQRQLALTNAADAKRNEEKAIEEGQKAKEAGETARLLAQKEKEAREQTERDKAVLLENEKRAEWRQYASNIALAQKAWETHDVAGVLSFLSQCRPDFRGWEHDYLYSLANQNQPILRLRNGLSKEVFSPDGTRLAGATSEGLHLVNVADGAELLTIKIDGADRLVEKTVFTPDGKRLVTAHNGEAWSWSAETGVLAGKFKGIPNKVVWRVAISPDGKHLAMGQNDTATVFNFATGGVEHRFTGHLGNVLGLAFSPDSKRLATGSSNFTSGGSAKLWDLATGKEIGSFEASVGDGVSCMAFSPDGNSLAIVGEPLVKLWNVETGKLILTFDGYVGRLFDVAFSPNGEYLVSNLVRRVKLSDTRTGKEVGNLQGNIGGFGCVYFSSDGKHLLTAGGQTLRRWDVAGTPDSLVLEGFAPCIFSPDGKSLAGNTNRSTGKASGLGYTNTAPTLWDTSSGQVLRAFKEMEVAGREGAFLTTMAFHPDGKRIATVWAHLEARDVIGLGGKTMVGGWSRVCPGTVRLLDVVSGEQLDRFDPDPPKTKGPVAQYTGLAFSPDGKWLASAFDSTLKLWDVATGDEVRTLNGVANVAFSPDGKYLATSYEKTVKLWNAASGEEIKTLEEHTNVVTRLVFTPDSKLLATGTRGDRPGTGGEIKLWDLASGREQLTRKIPGYRDEGFAFSPDGKRLATASAGGVTLLDTATGHEVLTLPGPRPEIAPYVVFSPDGKRLALGSGTGTGGRRIVIWDGSKSMMESEQK